MKNVNILCGIAASAAILLGGGYILFKGNKADVMSPQIIIEQETIECSVSAEEEELLKSIRAVDDIDGNLTDRVMVNDIRIRDNQKSEDRLFDVSYAVFDSSNNMATATRTLKYTDYHPARFSLTGELVFNSVTGVNLSNLLSAEDCIDGDISSQIMLELDEAFLNAVSAGEYTCVASVTNSVGDVSSIPLTFEVQDSGLETDSTRPVIQLSDYLVYVKKGEKFKPKKYLKKIKVDNTVYTFKNKSDLPDSMDLSDVRPYEFGYTVAGINVMLKDKVKVNSDVDTEVPGVYNVVFSYKHPEEGTRGSARLIVVVEE